MALPAVGGETAGAMIGDLGLFEIPGMAAITIGREPKAIELPDRSHFVAGIAINHSVSADQRKAILMPVDVVNRDLPAVGVVAQFALSPVLAAMQIGMAVLALIGSVGEVEVAMAVAARYGSMAAAQGKSRTRMIELDLVLDDVPVRGDVAGDARNIELAVRALRRSKGPRRLCTGSS
jgi:hypothetical protein